MLIRLSIIAAAVAISCAVRAHAQGPNTAAILQSAPSAHDCTPDKGGVGETELAAGLTLDAKGIEFGPWVRKFLAQVKHGWFPLIPPEARALRGHTTVRFVVHKSGEIEDVQVALPSVVESFNRAAFDALLKANPTFPLPPEYPVDTAAICLTFYYNEIPPSAGGTSPAASEDLGWSP